MSKVSFGVFDWIDRGTEPLNQLYEDRLRLLAAADEAGSSAITLPNTMRRRSGWRLAGAVPDCGDAAHTPHSPRATGLPAAALRSLTADRRGSDARSALGRSFGARRRARRLAIRVAQFRSRSGEFAPMFDEALAVLLAGLTQERLSFAGAALQYQNVPMSCIRCNSHTRRCGIRPTRPPASSTPAGTASISSASARPRRCASTPTPIGGRGGAPRRPRPAQRPRRRPKNRHLAPRRRRTTATRRRKRPPAPRMPVWFRSIMQLWHEHGDHSNDGLFSWEASVETKSILFGSPARTARDAAVVTVSGCNYVICAFAWGTLSRGAEHALAAPVRRRGNAGGRHRLIRREDLPWPSRRN